MATKKTAKRATKRKASKVTKASPKANAAKRISSQKAKPKGVTRTGGRPREYKPTQEHRNMVERLAGLRLSHAEIALLLLNPKTGRPISKETLQRNFRSELETGPAKSKVKATQHLFQQMEAGSVKATTFYLERQCGWVPRQVVEVESKTGVLVPPTQADPADWIAKVREANKERTNPSEARARKEAG